MSLNIFCANDECGAGYNLMGPDPAVNLGGQLIRVSKLGDVRAPAPPLKKPEEPVWFSLLMVVAGAVIFLAATALLVWMTGGGW